MNLSHPGLRDPRLYQILVLASLLVYGVTRLDLEIPPGRALLLLAAALLTQYACTRAWRLPAFDPRSALISGLSLCLLLRTNSAALAVLAAAVAIASKFVLRVRGKHIFNPTNFGIVATMLATGGVWVSPGQWGNAAFFAFLLACLGGLVVNRAARSDVTYAFLGFYLAILFGRALWLGQPLAIPLHQLGSGALPDLHLLHDLRPADDARLAGRPHPLRPAGRPRRRLRPVRPLPAQRAPAGALLPRARGPADRSAAARRALRLAPGEDPLRPALSPGRKEIRMKRLLTTVLTLAVLAMAARTALGFCGFYVAKADTKLFNQASQVVLVRDGDRTVLTMANDFKGDPKEFAIVIPVPTFLQKEQIHVAERALLDHLDAYSAPRLVEYFDGDPCQPVYADGRAGARRGRRRRPVAAGGRTAPRASA